MSDTEAYSLRVLDTLVFEVVNDRVPVGTQHSLVEELWTFSKEFRARNPEAVELALQQERERAARFGVDFSAEHFMNALEPAILKVAPKWLKEHPNPVY